MDTLRTPEWVIQTVKEGDTFPFQQEPSYHRVTVRGDQVFFSTKQVPDTVVTRSKRDQLYQSGVTNLQVTCVLSAMIA